MKIYCPLCLLEIIEVEEDPNLIWTCVECGYRGEGIKKK